MRILHTVELYHPHVGGAEEVVRTLSERLAERGHEVTVATSAHPDRGTDVVQNGVRVVSFDVHGNGAIGMRGEIERYRRFLVDGQFDLVMNYAAQAWPTDAAFEILPRLRSRRVLVPCGYSALHDPRYAGYFAALPAHLRRYDHLVYLSGSYQDKVFGDQHGIENCSIIPNAADERLPWDEPGDFNVRHGLRDRLTVLCVANHVRSKGHLRLIGSFLVNAGQDATLVIIGQPGTGRRRLTGCYYACRFAEMAWTHRVRVVRSNDRSEVVRAFAAADVFALASHVECSPLVLFEAMASRTPWVSTQVGNAAELPGGLVSSGMGEFGRQLGLLTRDGATREQLAQAGHAAWRERFTWDKVVDRYESLYKSLIA